MRETFVKIGATVFQLANPNFKEMHNFFDGDFPLQFQIKQARNRKHQILIHVYCSGAAFYNKAKD